MITYAPKWIRPRERSARVQNPTFNPPGAASGLRPKVNIRVRAAPWQLWAKSGSRALAVLEGSWDLGVVPSSPDVPLEKKNSSMSDCRTPVRHPDEPMLKTLNPKNEQGRPRTGVQHSFGTSI